MKIIGIDIGTTTISGVVLENKVEGQITTKAEEKLEKSLQVRKVVVSSSAIVQSFCRTDEKSLRVHHVEIYGVVPAFME